MMPTDQERAARVQKLLRLAAASSGAPESERTIAALAAADLFVELEDKGHSGRRQSRAASYASGPEVEFAYVEPWRRSRSSIIYLRCLHQGCARPIGINEACWRRVNNGVVE